MDRFPSHVAREVPNTSTRLYHALHNAGVRDEEFATVSNDPHTLRIVAAYIDSLLGPSNVGSTEIAPLERDPSWSESWTDGRTLFPSMTRETPARFARGLVYAGARAAQLNRVLEKPDVILKLAGVVRERAGNPIVLTFPESNTEAVDTTHDVVVPSARHARGVPVTVRGVGFEKGKSILSRLKDKNMVSEKVVTELVRADVSWLKRGEFTFRCVPSDTFSELMYGALLRTLSETYPKFKIDRIEMPLAAAFTQCLHERETLSKLKGRVDWIRVLHTPFADAAGHPRIVEFILDRSRRLARIELVTAPEASDRLEPNGALAVLVG